MANPIQTFDFTSYDTAVEPKTICDFLTQHCNSWCFQKELCPKTHNEHYQGRILTTKRIRLGQCIGLIHHVLPTAHVTPTATVNRRQFNYVLKEDTRIDGPWKDGVDDEGNAEEGVLYIQKHLRVEPTWNAWQRSVIDIIDTVPDGRTIHYIIKEGNVGGTTMCKYLHMHGIARRLPCINDMKELSQAILGTKPYKAYFIDMPKALNQQKLYGFYSAIEELVNGYAFDPRHKWKENYFEPPHVFVISNESPNLDVLVRDRWKIWHVTKADLELKQGPPPKKLSLNIIKINTNIVDPAVEQTMFILHGMDTVEGPGAPTYLGLGKLISN